jgi:CRISPR/Cas system CSM-associated protein Csm3 (group 7 of RAMP superfamily)
MVGFAYRLHGTLKALTPLHLGSGLTTGIIKHTKLFISGAVLRGAIGTAIMKAVCKHSQPRTDHENCEYFENCVYARMFGEEFGKSSKVFFRFSHPLHLECGGAFQPTPKTLHQCTNPQCKRPYDSFIPPKVCQCGFDVKPYQGYRCSSCKALEKRPVRISRITLTALDRQKLSAVQVLGPKGELYGTLHTLEVLERNSRFAFEILVWGDGGLIDVIKTAVERALPDEGIGGSKSRGLGKIAVERIDVEELDSSLVEKRAEELDARNFSVRLISPMVVQNGELLTPGQLLEAARRAYTLIFRRGKPKLPKVEREEFKAISYERFSGWSLRYQHRKRIEPALTSGSILQFKCEEPTKELALSLAALEYYAVGGYKPHGCGQITIEPPRQITLKA